MKEILLSLASIIIFIAIIIACAVAVFLIIRFFDAIIDFFDFNDDVHPGD